MISAEEARKKIDKQYEIVDGRLIGNTYCFSLKKGGKSVHGVTCIDAKTGEFCGQLSALELSKKWKDAPKA